MIICERPKLWPHSPVMREPLSNAPSIDVNDICVKASTAEGLGTIGGGDVIAAHVVTI